MTRVKKVVHSLICISSFLARFFVNDVEHLSLDGLFLQDKSVLVPDEVRIFDVESMPLHAAFE